MNFIVDAQLPHGLAQLLQRFGHDAIHTTDLPAGNATPDSEINRLSVSEQRVVISKDSDFFYSHVLEGRPWKLLLVRTGNISTRELVSLFERNLAPIESALLENNLVEIDHETVRPRTQR